MGNDVNTLYNHYVGAGKAEGRLPYDPNALPTKEIEPNHSRERATNIMVGIACTGELGSYSKYRADGCTDVDWFSISLEGGKKYRIDMPGFSDNFASTTMMANIITPEERQDNLSYYMKRNGIDYVIYTAPVSGTYYIKIHNYLDTRTKTEHYYVLSFTEIG